MLMKQPQEITDIVAAQQSCCNQELIESFVRELLHFLLRLLDTLGIKSKRTVERLFHSLCLSEHGKR